MPHYCLPWKICFSKRIKRICCKRVAQRLKHHHCRYQHAVHPFQISVINSIYRQHRWHRIQVKRTIITVLLPISWIHWISIHLRIYCERFVYSLLLFFFSDFFFVNLFVWVWVTESKRFKYKFCVCECEWNTRNLLKSDRVYLIVVCTGMCVLESMRIRRKGWSEWGKRVWMLFKSICKIAQNRQWLSFDLHLDTLLNYLKWHR